MNEHDNTIAKLTRKAAEEAQVKESVTYHEIPEN